MTLRFLACLSIVVCFSCLQNRQSQIKELYGIWTRDSFSTVTGKIISDSSRFQQISFSAKGNFTYSWMNDDVGGEYKGRYFVNENPARQCKTITLLADLVISGPDTIRRYFNFDILALDTRRLKTSSETAILERKNGRAVYTPISIFRR